MFFGAFRSIGSRFVVMMLGGIFFLAGGALVYADQELKTIDLFTETQEVEVGQPFSVYTRWKRATKSEALNLDDITLPGEDAFVVLGTHHSIQAHSGAGQSGVVYVVEQVLEPTKPGTFRLGPVEIPLKSPKGESLTLKSPVIEIKVSPPTGAGQKPAKRLPDGSAFWDSLLIEPDPTDPRSVDHWFRLQVVSVGGGLVLLVILLIVLQRPDPSAIQGGSARKKKTIRKPKAPLQASEETSPETVLPEEVVVPPAPEQAPASVDVLPEEVIPEPEDLVPDPMADDFWDQVETFWLQYLKDHLGVSFPEKVSRTELQKLAHMAEHQGPAFLEVLALWEKHKFAPSKVEPATMAHALSALIDTSHA